MSSFHFNSILLEISNQLSADQLDQLKFLCRDRVGKRDLERIDTGRKLFQVLVERGMLGADNRECLSQLLQQIHRPDLSHMLDCCGCESASGFTDNQLDDDEGGKLNAATEVVAENLGKTWRKLGRKLGLSDVKLESISKRHPTDVEETVVELLKEWRKSRGAEARAEELIKALRACQYNLTADKVESRLADL